MPDNSARRPTPGGYLNIIDRVDTEVLDQVLLGFPLLPDCKDSLAPCPDARQHHTNDHAPEELTGEDMHALTLLAA
jgi:hypothetical protein